MSTGSRRSAVACMHATPTTAAKALPHVELQRPWLRSLSTGYCATCAARSGVYLNSLWCVCVGADVVGGAIARPDDVSIEPHVHKFSLENADMWMQIRDFRDKCAAFLALALALNGRCCAEGSRGSCASEGWSAANLAAVCGRYDEEGLIEGGAQHSDVVSLCGRVIRKRGQVPRRHGLPAAPRPAPLRPARRRAWALLEPAHAHAGACGPWREAQQPVRTHA